VADNGSGSYTFSSSTTLTTSADQLLFKGVAEVDTSITGTGLFQLFSFSSFSVGGTNYGSQNAQFAIDNSVQLATMDVNNDGTITARDVLLVYRYLPFIKGGLQKTGNAIFPEGKPTFPDIVTTSGELVELMDKIIGSKVFDVNKDGKVTARDVLLVYRYLPFIKGGLQKTGNAIFPEGKPTFPDTVTSAAELVNNINDLVK
jgi:hypothetical protein